ncbi:MAG: 1-(5-phosphoribosyl)-5-[(5-phosphoribosylamino)methylideneamino]imidazole-4-carboxamide isomerase [Opitutus sp.]|nr:1-(5-phosphoribosyl)-5-[(5-phosphoribosylamino)methylideneamino]imidazole-4-carboxamide isomerase [Opitutus sp.]
MIIYPAIDIKGGRCVRLTQGRADQETVYSENPADVAAEFRAAGADWVHVVDLDGAFAGEPKNLSTVEAIVALGMKVQLGGGLRTRAAIERALAAGVSRVVIGTRAVESPTFVGDVVRLFGDKIAVGLDARNGMVAVKGWVETAGMSALQAAQQMDVLGVATLIHTDIDTDGMLNGPNFQAQEAMLRVGRFRVIASGGVSTREDVVKLTELARRYAKLDGVIVGKALYEKRVELPDLLAIAQG